METCNKEQIGHQYASMATHQIHNGPSTPACTSPTLASNSWQFISDLNPESGFAGSSLSGVQEAASGVGIWINESEWTEFTQKVYGNDRNGAATLPQSIQKGGLASHPDLSRDQVQGLIDVYFRKIHPLLPLLDEFEFRQALGRGSLPDVYVYAVCLVATKEADAEAYLPHSNTGAKPSIRAFSSALYCRIKVAIAAHHEYDKVTLIRIHALLSMHSEGRHGVNESSMCVMRAMHHCQSLGLHLRATRFSRSQASQQMKQVFWCVWILDRFNAAVSGRPTIIADQDISQEVFESGRSGFPAFDILLQVTRLLNQIFKFYRPRVSTAITGWEEDFPEFARFVDDSAGWNLPTSLLATLHVAYLSVSALSHRSRGIHFSYDVTTPSRLRQTLAATQLIRIMSPGQVRSLHSLPILPYAISLALSVSYQGIRQAHLVHQKEEAFEEFKTGCGSLLELGRAWASLDVMISITQKLLHEPARLTHSLSTSQNCSGNGAITHVNSYENFERAYTRKELAGEQGLPSVGCESCQLQRCGNASESKVRYSSSQAEKENLFESIDDMFGSILDPSGRITFDVASFPGSHSDCWVS